MPNDRCKRSASAGTIVWIDYCKIRGKVVAANIGQNAVIRRSGESLQAFEGRTMSRSVGALYRAIKGS